MEVKQKIFVTIGTVAILAAAAVGGVALFTNNSSNTASTGTTTAQSSTSSSGSTGISSATNTSSSTTTSSGTSSSTTSGSGYKDGTYTKTISYSVPHGYSNSITVTLVVSGGNITSVTTNDNYSDNESGRYVSSFESSVSSDAKGQALSSYSPSRIGGASLTIDAFAQAVSAIRSDAAA